MADQPNIKVISARDATYQGVATRVPATVSVDGRPVARCEDEAIAHLVAAVYLQGPDAVEALKDSAAKIASLESQAATDAQTIATLQSELQEALDDAAAANSILADKQDLIAKLNAQIEELKLEALGAAVDAEDTQALRELEAKDSDGGTATGPHMAVMSEDQVNALRAEQGLAPIKAEDFPLADGEQEIGTLPAGSTVTAEAVKQAIADGPLDETTKQMASALVDATFGQQAAAATDA